MPRWAAAGALLVLAAGIADGAANAAVEVSVSKRGFEPSRLTARRGEAIQLVLTTTDGEHCFAIDALRVEKRVRPGRPTRLELVPDEVGEMPFYCCLESGGRAEVERGVLVVTD